jgi:hypothetical protein
MTVVGESVSRMALQATSVWLAATKLSIPARRHDALLRPRLIDVLAKSLVGARLSLIPRRLEPKGTLLAELPHAFPERLGPVVWTPPQSSSGRTYRVLAAAGIEIEEDVAGQRRPYGGYRHPKSNRAKQATSSGDVIDDLYVISDGPCTNCWIIWRTPSPACAWS